MSTVMLIAIVVAVFAALCLLVLFFPSGKPGKKNRVSLQLDKNTAVNISKDAEKSVIRIEYTSFDEIPSPIEVLDDYFPELPEQEGALNEEFWAEYSKFKSLPAKRKFELCERLVEHGLMDRRELDEFTFPIPVDESTGKPVIELPPPPDSKDDLDEFWRKSFPGE